jgi:tRNA(fMet)-specific endonuclease VapC
MPSYLLDTNICIYIAKRKPPEVLRRFESLKAGDLAMSLVTYGELIDGAERGTQRLASMAIIARVLEAVPVLAMSIDTALHYGAIRAALASNGVPIGNNDLWIAAHARAAGLTLVTNNEAEFRRVPNLRVENWVAAA